MLVAAALGTVGQARVARPGAAGARAGAARRRAARRRARARSGSCSQSVRAGGPIALVTPLLEPADRQRPGLERDGLALLHVLVEPPLPLVERGLARVHAAADRGLRRRHVLAGRPALAAGRDRRARGAQLGPAGALRTGHPRRHPGARRARRRRRRMHRRLAQARGRGARRSRGALRRRRGPRPARAARLGLDVRGDHADRLPDPRHPRDRGSRDDARALVRAVDVRRGHPALRGPRDRLHAAAPLRPRERSCRHAARAEPHRARRSSRATWRSASIRSRPAPCSTGRRSCSCSAVRRTRPRTCAAPCGSSPRTPTPGCRPPTSRPTSGTIPRGACKSAQTAHALAPFTASTLATMTDYCSAKARDEGLISCR